jgi:hypothetical protein
MDLPIGLLSLLLAASAATYLWLTFEDSHRTAARTTPTGPAIALDDLIGARHPLFPHTIRQTPFD